MSLCWNTINIPNQENNRSLKHLYQNQPANEVNNMTFANITYDWNSRVTPTLKERPRDLFGVK
jgi:hypothetical protein